MRRRITVRFLPVLTVAFLGITGCGGAEAPPAPAGAPSSDPTIQGYRFPALTAAPGSTVTVSNGDEEPHTVTADDGSFDTGSFDGSTPGTFMAPTQPGTYPIHCTIHPSMHGTLTVS